MTLELMPHALAIGGEAVAREDSGRVVFVVGALPGDHVRVELVDERKRYARGRVVEVLAPGPGRIAPPCPAVAAGCGGCDLQYADLDTQRALKRGLVADALERTGGIAEPVVADGAALAGDGFRTSVRAAVVGGRAGFRRRRGHDVVTPESCLVAHPLVEEILVGGRFGDAAEVTIRVGAATGERLVVSSPTAGDARVPADVVVCGADELGAGRVERIHEVVAGHRFAISARSFFQSRPDGAEALVHEVRRALGEPAPSHLIDAFAGVGLFAATIPAGRVTAIETSALSAADARENLTGFDAEVVHADVARARCGPADAVVADPARKGLGARVVTALAASGAERLVLVSCDAAALGRDAGLLVAAGYTHVESRLVDLFPHTHNVEVVSGFRRDRAQG